MIQATWRMLSLGILMIGCAASSAMAGAPPNVPVHKTGAVVPVSTDTPSEPETGTAVSPAGDLDEQTNPSEPVAPSAESDVEPNPTAVADVHAAAIDHASTEHGTASAEHGDKLGNRISRLSLVPFAALLGCIAIFPLVNPHWWEHNRNKGIIVAVLAVPTVAYLLAFGHAGSHALEHSLKEYVSFVILLGSLFVISGGVYVRGSLQGAPVLNTIFLAIGASIASIVGTTGASMLLIRPLLRANKHRDRVAHIVIFFIFTVSNCGGLLTPLGDPPLFLGFLKGVDFLWTLRLWPQWLLVNGTLLAVFFLWDTLAYRKEQPKPAEATLEEKQPFGIEGAHNFLYLAAIVAIIYCSGQNVGGFGEPGEPWPWGLQESLMAVVTALAYLTTSGQLRIKNRFTFGPIIEVAVLFIGIFCTMIPALAILNVEGKNLGLTEPMQFFWASGLLSSFLDNAPTYVAFAATAAGVYEIPDEGRFLAVLLEQGGTAAAIIAAISCGSVFMGANTYIGNGPNFMVKAIAEENNVQMPTFFGYMLYSVGILIPIFVLVSAIFFRTSP